MQQTRVGMVVGEGTPFKGTLEIDFVHFDQSSPFAQAYPRIRIGLLEWAFKPNQKFFMGQTWDIFGNATGASLLSHSFNLVGTLFQAGNIGFMRPAARLGRALRSIWSSRWRQACRAQHRRDLQQHRSVGRARPARPASCTTCPAITA